MLSGRLDVAVMASPTKPRRAELAKFRMDSIIHRRCSWSVGPSDEAEVREGTRYRGRVPMPLATGSFPFSGRAVRRIPVRILPLLPNKKRRLMRCEEQFLQPVGNTVRHTASQRSGAQAVLVINDTITSHFWLNILPMVRDNGLRYFIALPDLERMCDQLHVRPTLVPCFIVFRAGYMVDWFPAPLPNAGLAADPQSLAEVVRLRLRSYEDDHGRP